MINISVQITCVLLNLMFENVPEKTLENYKTYFTWYDYMRSLLTALHCGSPS